MINLIIDEILDSLKKIKFDENLPKYKDRLLNELKLNDWKIYGNQFFIVFDIHIQENFYTHQNINEILGINEDNITIKNLLSLIYSEDCGLVLKAVKKILYEGLYNRENKPLDDVYCMEFRFNKINNEIIWVKTEILTLVKDNTGIPLMALIQITEINENTEPKEFKMYYCGRNSKNIDFTTGRHITYKKGNCLTEREKEILQLIVVGLKNKEIAESLNIALSTVNKHRNNILEKTGQHNTVGLIKWKKENL